jgi:phospholipase/lecithinase/hemolysin
MKKLLSIILLALCFSTSHAAQINKIVFFGDSLTDDGNLYQRFKGMLPKEPYSQGRFSNGPVWAEDVKNYYYEKYGIAYHNDAMGGATAKFHFPDGKNFSPTTLEEEIDNYLEESASEDKTQTLYIIFIGSNDYFYTEDLTDNATTQQVVDVISESMVRLVQAGAKNFVVMTLPDTSRIPYAAKNGLVERLHRLIPLHNQKLQTAVEALRMTHPAIRVATVDIYNFFNDIIENPKKYNEKYHVNLVNTTDACWQGGYMTPHYNSLTAEMLNKALARSPDAQKLSNMVMQSPSLATAYQMSQAYSDEGAVECPNPEQYLFWDAMHPTQVVHQMLAKIAEESILNQLI